MARRSADAVAASKRQVLDLLASGLTVEKAMSQVRLSVKTYENWRSADPAFKREVEDLRAAMSSARKAGEVPGGDKAISFADWRKKYLGRDTYPHQQAWIDLIEGREPALRDGEELTRGDKSRVIINVPPFHCAEVSTPILTRDGWKTVGEVTADDHLIDPSGFPQPVLEVWEPESEVDLFEVRFNTGDVITTDAGHKWVIEDTRGASREVTTAWLVANPTYSGKTRWRVPMAKPVQFEERDLPLDPYLMGYWLGDGDKNGSRFAVSEIDKGNLTRTLEAAGFTWSASRDGRGVAQVYARKMRHLLPLGEKQIPADYMLGSYEQRLALLQGLMDTDGTINPRDGRASFIQVDGRLARDVYRLVASLGMQPRIKHEKQNPVAPNGVASSDRIWRVYFKPNGTPVFRLFRKLGHQKMTDRKCKTNNRTIESVVPAGRGRVKCITVLSDGNLFLIGDGLIQTHNAKSATLTVDYVVYRICLDHNIRVIVVSKRQDQANKFLYAIKQRLTSRQWAALQAAYAPPGGFKPDRGEGQWGANRFYVSSDDREEKDPTVEALGLGSQIYGSRADLIILDDCVVLSNAHEYEKQITWLQSEVESRVKDGTILLVGTRLAAADLYSELLNGDRYLSGTSPWTYLRQPAVLQYAERPEDWVTLWPKSSTPLEAGHEPGPDGLYVAWDGVSLNRERNRKTPKTWSLVYMQQTVADDAVFNAKAVMACTDRRRVAGPLIAGAMGHPRNGMEGQYVIASMDPAMSGDTFTLVGAVDRIDKKRRILNAWVKSSPTPAYIRDLIKSVTDEYGVQEWVIEQNAFQLFLTTDEDITAFMRERGIKFTGHYTSRNKIDPDFGVASVASLFGSMRTDENMREHHNDDELISLPDPRRCEGVKALIEQLVAWQPGKLGKQLKQDGPMALWFFELRAREILGVGQRRQQHFLDNKYLTKADLARRVVIPADSRYAFLGESA